MLLDGLEDAYDNGKPMGAFAEETARSYQIGRAAQDEYALRSLERAKAAQASGAFDAEIVPVLAGKETIRIDEQPGRAKPDKIPFLKPAFAADGTITAASSASISDGAAALVLTRESLASDKALRPSRASSAMPRMPRRQLCSPPRRCLRSENCWTASAGAPPMSIFSRSMKPSRWWR